LQHGLDIEGKFPEDYSGTSVVLSEDGTVVGIGERNSKAGNTGSFDKNYGQVRVFESIEGKWFQRGEAITGDDKCDFASSGGGLGMNAAGMEKDAFELLVELMGYEPYRRLTASEALLETYLNPTCTEPIQLIPPVSKPWSITFHIEKWNIEY